MALSADPCTWPGRGRRLTTRVVSGMTGVGTRYPPYLHRSSTARGFRGVPDSAPCSLIAAGGGQGAVVWCGMPVCGGSGWRASRSKRGERLVASRGQARGQPALHLARGALARAPAT